MIKFPWVGSTTRRLELRPYRAADHGTWAAAYVDRLPAQNRFDLGPMPAEKCSPAEFKKLRERHAQLARKDQVYIYGIFRKREGVLVGTIDIAIICRDNYQMANFGYRLHNRYWGEGYGREAAICGLKIGFSHLCLNRLEAAIDPDNRRSLALAKAVGMRREGIKKNYLFEDGQWNDQIIFVANPADVGLKPSRPVGRDGA